MADASVRAFIALPLPPPIKERLAEAQRMLQERTGAPGVRWVQADGMHLTLKFLGDTPTARLSAVERSMQDATHDVAPIELGLTTLGAFPNARRPRVVWAGLRGDLDALEQLFQRLEEALHLAGFPKETRPLSPHITLGRVSDNIAPNALGNLTAALSAAPSLEATPGLTGERLVLFQSTLTPRGAIYTELSSAQLEVVHYEQDAR